MSLLQQFNGDLHTKGEVKDFIDNFIAEEGVRRIFDRQDVSAIADAKDLIDKAFEALDQLYGIKTPEKTVTNKAR